VNDECRIVRDFEVIGRIGEDLGTIGNGPKCWVAFQGNLVEQQWWTRILTYNKPNSCPIFLHNKAYPNPKNPIIVTISLYN